MRAYNKSVLRCFRSNLGRMIAISVIIFLGVAFVAGLGSLAPQIEKSFSDYMKDNNVPDIVAKATSADGFSAADIDSITSQDYIKSSKSFTSMDMMIDDLNTRAYIMDINDDSINKLELVSGRLPQSLTEVVVERASSKMTATNIGDKITFMGITVTVVGEVVNPMHFNKHGEVDVINQELLQRIFYAEKKYVPVALPITDIYLTIVGAESMNVYSKGYEKLVADKVDSLKAIDNDSVYLTLSENKSTAILGGYCDKVVVISWIFPLFFIAVAALTVLTTMRRLIEEERPVIGCYMTLGVPKSKITWKYIAFSATCCVVMAVLGVVLGIWILPSAIFPAFAGLFFLPAFSMAINVLPGILAALAMLIAVVGVTYMVVHKELKEVPAETLRTKAPRAGKKILLERIPFIWKPMSFRLKSTFRNIFRYTNHLVMTIISVSGSTALAFAGLALSDIAKAPAEISVDGFGDLFAPISAVIIMFAILLCGFVVYNLTNMNIGERKREIATLKVLGYTELETAGYIYREIFIMSLMGVLTGIPLGVGLIAFVFNYLDFGRIADVQWTSYVGAGVIVMAFICIVDILLASKIRKIDMTTSLKSVE